MSGGSTEENNKVQTKSPEKLQIYQSRCTRFNIHVNRAKLLIRGLLVWKANFRRFTPFEERRPLISSLSLTDRGSGKKTREGAGEAIETNVSGQCYF